MSVRINLSDLTVQDRTKISKSLRFDKRETSYNKYKPSATIYAYDIEEIESPEQECLQMLNKSSDGSGSDGSGSDGSVQFGYIYLPFWWGLKNIPSATRPSRSVFVESSAIFTGKLRPLQQEVRSEALTQLNKYGSCILSLYTEETITLLEYCNKDKIKNNDNMSTMIDQWKQSIEKVCPGAPSIKRNR